MRLSYCTGCFHKDGDYCCEHEKLCIYVRNCKDYEEDNEEDNEAPFWSPWPNEDDPDGDDQPSWLN